MEEYVHRYRLDDGRYWGSTITPEEFDLYGYTDIEPPNNYDVFNQIPVWRGDHWEVRDLVAGM